MNNRVIIIAGEASGDLHGSRLVKAMKAKNPELEFFGIGGEEMSRAGVKILFDAAKIAVVGIWEILSHLKDIHTARNVIKKELVENKPALLILIDFPDFNLMLARQAKKNDIPIFYYISPQVWAWRSGRVKTIGKLIDKVGVILPFEEKFYKDRGVDAQYVGHPLLDSVNVRLNRVNFCRKFNIDVDKKLVGLMPGSRKKEIESLLPEFLEAAYRLHLKNKNKIVFLLPIASTILKQDLLDNGLENYKKHLDIRLIYEDRYDMMSACDAAVVASGTATLELAILDTPMVVTYKLSPATYFLGRLLVKIKYFSLVNLIADCEVIKELFQKEVNPERIETELTLMLYNKKKLKGLKKGLLGVRNKLGNAGASKQAAQMALKIMHKCNYSAKKRLACRLP